MAQYLRCHESGGQISWDSMFVYTQEREDVERGAHSMPSWYWVPRERVTSRGHHYTASDQDEDNNEQEPMKAKWCQAISFETPSVTYACLICCSLQSICQNASLAYTFTLFYHHPTEFFQLCYHLRFICWQGLEIPTMPFQRLMCTYQFFSNI